MPASTFYTQPHTDALVYVCPHTLEHTRRHIQSVWRRKKKEEMVTMLMQT